MSTEGIVIYSIAGVLLLISFFKDRQKTLKGIKKGFMSFVKLMPVLLPLFLVIGVLLAVITPELISGLLGESSGFFGYVFGLVLGSVTFMPPFVAYPLGNQLLSQGAAYPQVAGFLVTLMSVGLIYFAAESRYFSKKSAMIRNLVSFIGAIIVILVVLVVY